MGWVIRGPQAGVCFYEAENHTRGPRTIERSEIVWGGLSGVGSRKCASCFSRFLAEENGKKPFVKEVYFLLGEKIVEKAEKKSSGLGFVKVVHFLLGAKFAELRPGKGGS